jgi:hypothetical protein
MSTEATAAGSASGGTANGEWLAAAAGEAQLSAPASKIILFKISPNALKANEQLSITIRHALGRRHRR